VTLPATLLAPALGPDSSRAPTPTADPDAAGPGLLGRQQRDRNTEHGNQRGTKDIAAIDATSEPAEEPRPFVEACRVHYVTSSAIAVLG
jgi:hypothetical protein